MCACVLDWSIFGRFPKFSKKVKTRVWAYAASHCLAAGGTRMMLAAIVGKLWGRASSWEPLFKILKDCSGCIAGILFRSSHDEALGLFLQLRHFEKSLEDVPPTTQHRPPPPDLSVDDPPNPLRLHSGKALHLLVNMVRKGLFGCIPWGSWPTS